jgi:hypothetical protein
VIFIIFRFRPPDQPPAAGNGRIHTTVRSEGMSDACCVCLPNLWGSSLNGCENSFE